MRHWQRTLITATVLIMAKTTIAQAEDIPITRVILFRSGVGYIERSGSVDGVGSLTLNLKTDQMNDLLKSLVLQDLDGGRILPVQYPPQDPLDRTMRSFAVNLGDNPSRSVLLQRLRGVSIEVVMNTPSDKPIRGRVISVQARQATTDRVTTSYDELHLMTYEGIQTLNCDQIKQFKVLDERIQNEMQAALETLAGGLDTTRKPVQLQFSGRGKRRVLVGYITEMPVWKMSYRLVLADSGPSLLQGWAIAENTSEEDWRNVQISLVSGKPVSFIQNLYQPLYNKRPVFTPQIDAGLLPQTYTGALEEWDKKADGRESNERAKAAAPGSPAAEAGALRGGGFGGGGGGPAGRVMMDMESMGESVEAMATGQEVGALFEYSIDQPVTILRQQSAMLPVINQRVEAESLSVYNPNTNARFPLYGAKLKNATPLTLMEGPITVYLDNSYGGDALIETIEPGGERYLTYALDMKVEVNREGGDNSQQVVALKIVRGVLDETIKNRIQSKYVIRNRDTKNRALIIEQPINEGWELMEPQKVEEKTANLYRFRVELAADKTTELSTVEEIIVSQTFALSSMDLDQIRLYLRNPKASNALKTALQEIIKRQGEISQTQAEIGRAQAQIKSIDEDQARIRQNMQQLEKTSDLYKQYVKKLTDQEAQLERLRDEINSLNTRLQSQRSSLANYIQNLNVE